MGENSAITNLSGLFAAEHYAGTPAAPLVEESKSVVVGSARFSRRIVVLRAEHPPPCVSHLVPNNGAGGTLGVSQLRTTTSRAMAPEKLFLWRAAGERQWRVLGVYRSSSGGGDAAAEPWPEDALCAAMASQKKAKREVRAAAATLLFGSAEAAALHTASDDDDDDDEETSAASATASFESQQQQPPSSVFAAAQQWGQQTQQPISVMLQQMQIGKRPRGNSPPSQSVEEEEEASPVAEILSAADAQWLEIFRGSSSSFCWADFVRGVARIAAAPPPTERELQDVKDLLCSSGDVVDAEAWRRFYMHFRSGGAGSSVDFGMARRLFCQSLAWFTGDTLAQKTPACGFGTVRYSASHAEALVLSLREDDGDGSAKNFRIGNHRPGDAFVLQQVPGAGTLRPFAIADAAMQPRAFFYTISSSSSSSSSAKEEAAAEAAAEHLISDDLGVVVEKLLEAHGIKKCCPCLRPTYSNP